MAVNGIVVSVIGAKSPDDVSIIKVSGYLDTTTARDLETALNNLLDKGSYKIVLDLSGVTYISSAGSATTAAISSWRRWSGMYLRYFSCSSSNRSSRPIRASRRPNRPLRRRPRDGLSPRPSILPFLPLAFPR